MRKTKVVEQILLLGDETLEAYHKALCEALEEAFTFGDDVHWYLQEVGQKHVVICVAENGDEDFFLVPYERTEGGTFVFGEPAEVEKVVSFVPTKTEACGIKRKHKSDMKRPVAAPGIVDAIVRGPAHAPQVTEEQAGAVEAVVQLNERRAPACERRFEERTLNALIKAEAGADGFLRILEARGAVAGKVNANERLYNPSVMKREALRWAEEIRKGTFIPGEADHPESAPRILATCTKLLGASYDEVTGDLRVKFGLINSFVGQHVAALMDAGMPIGTSTRAIGYSETRTMNENDEFAEANYEHLGKKYEYVYDFTLKADDLVVEPSAGTHVGESLAESLRVLTEGETIQDKRDITREQEENSMDKVALKKALEGITPEELVQIAPELFEAIRKLGEKAPTEVAEQVSSLRADITAFKQVADELKTKVGSLEAERDQAKTRVAKMEAASIAVAGAKEHKRALEAYLREHFLESEIGLDKLPEIVARHEKTFGAYLAEAGNEKSEIAPGGENPSDPGDFLDGVMFA